MRFVDRKRELARLRRGLTTDAAWLCVLWGRRRIGKSRLLLEWLDEANGLYFVADQSAAALQRSYFATAVAARFSGFADVTYPDWRSMLDRLAAEARARHWTGPLVIDEFPYLVISDPSLPSVLQNWIDTTAKNSRLKVVLSGSSQRMMQGLVFDATAPLFGRATESFALKPLPPGVIGEALGLKDPREMIAAYAVWGGTPRYWELAEPFGGDVDWAVDSLVLDPLGILHHEPDRLLLEESPPAVALRPLLDIIGAGAHRVSEIAGRLGQPTTSLGRPMSRLQELGLVRRETPFGFSERSGKKSLYMIEDPFIRMWTRVVAPHRSLLATASKPARQSIWRRYQGALRAQVWEELCRQSVPNLSPPGSEITWNPARRYWRGNDPEFDVVAESTDGARLLLGEVKWSTSPVSASDVQGIYRRLVSKGLPGGIEVRTRRIEYAIFVPELQDRASQTRGEHLTIFTATELIDALRE